jgi:ribosomal protein S18 acetylase RimI-like enzyme
MLSYSTCDDGAMRETRIYRQQEEAPQQQQQQYSAKRPRKLSSWESSLTNNAERPGLSDLFGCRQHHQQQQQPHAGNLDSSQGSRHAHGNEQRHSFLQGNFFTLRLEHREGGNLARHFGEERFLLFRSDRAGAIAKVIFSSTTDAGSESYDNKAKVHVLDVKSDYRGKDLGGLLFTEAMNSLMERYEDENVACQLDAEEDVQRHDRLLQFYQHLGCEVKPKAKIQYINNNDGETYRKIPMRIDVNSRQRKGHQTSMLGAQFLPIQLLEAAGHRAELDLLGQESTRRLDWLLIDDGSGRIHFRTTVGHYLRANEFGHCAAVEEQDDLCFYLLYRVSDEGSDISDEELGDSDEVRRKELWMLQSTHGNFLTIDGQSLACSKAPSFWQADDQALTLTCTSDTPPRRQHYRQYWVKQTVAYVQEMRQRYLSFELAKMTLQQALHSVDTVPCHPYSVQTKGPSTRTLCVSTAWELVMTDAWRT